MPSRTYFTVAPLKPVFFLDAEFVQAVKPLVTGTGY